MKVKNTDDKMNILMVHNYYQVPGGEDTVVANEKKMLEEHGHKVILYTRSNSELKQWNLLQKLLLPFKLVFNFKTYSDIKKIIKEEKIDIVHVHNTLTIISPSVYYVALACNVPIVQTIHNFRLLCPAATFYRDGHICEDCVKKGLRCAVKHNCYRNSKIQTLACFINTKFHRMTGIYGKINYICLTEFNKEKLLQLKGIKKENVFVKPNFVKQSLNMVSAENRKNRIVFVGRLDKLKGVDIILQAYKLMGNEAPELIICGTGPLETWCKQYIKENNLLKVKLIGFLSNDEVVKIIAESKALLLPTQWYEGFPVSIVEAFSVGTPVIGSDIGNVGNLIREGVTGFRIKDNSAEGIVDALQRMVAGGNIFESVIHEYNMKYTEIKNYKELKDIYNNIIDANFKKKGESL